MAFASMVDYLRRGSSPSSLGALTRVSFDKSIASPPIIQITPPTHMDWIPSFPDIVTMNGLAIFPRLLKASTIPVPVVLILEGKDSVVIKLKRANPKAELGKRYCWQAC